MDARKLRLAVAAAIFVSWIGYLFYLAMGARHTVVLSRPQFLVSPLWIQGSVTKDPGRPVAKVEVRKVFRPPDKAALEGTTITVAGLPNIEALGWSGPGEYILPLSETREGKTVTFHLTPVPDSPGFVPSFYTVRIQSPGNQKRKLTDVVAHLSGSNIEEVEKLLTRFPADIMHKVPLAEAEGIKKELQNLGAAENGDDKSIQKPIVRLMPEPELRIYPVTAETLAQIETLPGR